MSRPAYRLPRRVVLPFGYIIKVKLASAALIREKAGEKDLAAFPEHCNGAWIVDEQSIYIYQGLSPAKRRYVLAHELDHAINDWMDYLLEWGIVKP